jgi:hypothetical protein
MKMRFSNSFKSSLAVSVAAITIWSLFISQSAFAAGSITGWGSMAVDSGELGCKDLAELVRFITPCKNSIHDIPHTHDR